MSQYSNFPLPLQIVGCIVAAYWALILLRIAAFAGLVMLERLGRLSGKMVAIAGEAVAFAVVWPIAYAVDHAEKWAAFAAEWRTQRRIWRKEFRKQIRWSEFRLTMAGRGKVERDDYADALSLFGLAEPFTRREMDTRFKRIMFAVHPDKGGTDYLAQLTTAARTLILKRKGWKP